MKSKTRARTEIEGWLAGEIAKRIKKPRSQIDVQAPLAGFGVDSVEAAQIVGDLELWLGRRLEPTLLWKYRTIQALAKRLHQDPRSLKTGSR